MKRARWVTCKLPSRNIQANAHKKKKCNKPATMPQTILWLVWPIPHTKSTSAISRHTQRFLWIVVLSDCKSEIRESEKKFHFAAIECRSIGARAVIYITFSPRNNWNVRMARTRQTTEMMQPIYVMICRATWWAMSSLTACTSISTRWALMPCFAQNGYDWPRSRRFARSDHYAACAAE